MIPPRLFPLFLHLLTRVSFIEGTDEGRASTTFTFSDAKIPDFNLRGFQGKAISEGDSVPSESIILPTLNIESHPYAVVVVPGLDKFSSSNFRNHRRAADDAIQGSDIGVKREAIPSADIAGLSSQNDNGKFEDPVKAIGVFPNVKADEQVIDLTSFGENFNATNKTSHEDTPNSEINIPTEGINATLKISNIIKNSNDAMNLGEGVPEILIESKTEQTKTDDIKISDKDENKDKQSIVEKSNVDKSVNSTDKAGNTEKSINFMSEESIIEKPMHLKSEEILNIKSLNSVNEKHIPEKSLNKDKEAATSHHSLLNSKNAEIRDQSFTLTQATSGDSKDFNTADDITASFSELKNKLDVTSNNKEIDDTVTVVAAVRENKKGKSLGGTDNIVVSKASLHTKSTQVFQGYPRREGDLLSSPIQVPVSSEFPNSEEVFERGPLLLKDSRGSEMTLKGNGLQIPKPLTPIAINRQDAQIQTLPIVTQFSLLENLVPPYKEYRLQNMNSVSKNQFQTLENARETPSSPHQINQQVSVHEINNFDKLFSNEEEFPIKTQYEEEFPIKTQYEEEFPIKTQYEEEFPIKTQYEEKQPKKENQRYVNYDNREQKIDLLRINDNIGEPINENNVGMSVIKQSSADTVPLQNTFSLEEEDSQQININVNHRNEFKILDENQSLQENSKEIIPGENFMNSFRTQNENPAQLEVIPPVIPMNENFRIVEENNFRNSNESQSQLQEISPQIGINNFRNPDENPTQADISQQIATNENNFGNGFRHPNSNENLGPIQENSQQILINENNSGNGFRNPNKNPTHQNLKADVRKNVNSLVKQILESNSSLLNSAFPTNVFEFVRSVGLPLQNIQNENEKVEAGEPPLFNVKESSDEDQSSPEKNKEINQLIQLRDQLTLLNSAFFSNKNSHQSNVNEFGPENSVGLFTVHSGESRPVNTQSNTFIDNSQKSNVNLLTTSFDDSKKDPNIQKFSNSTNSSILNQTSSNFEHEISTKESKKSPVMNWGTFLRENEKNVNKEKSPTISDPKEFSEFNHLESIKTPIKTPLNLNTEQEVNPNKTFNVILEKFDISNVIPPKTHYSLSLEQDSFEDSVQSGSDPAKEHSRENTQFSNNQQPYLDVNYQIPESTENNHNLGSGSKFSGQPQLPHQNRATASPYVESSIGVPSIETYTATPCLGRDCLQDFALGLQTVTEYSSGNEINEEKGSYLPSTEKEAVPSTPTYKEAADCIEESGPDCSDATLTSQVFQDVPLAVTSTVFDFVPHTVTRPVHVTETVLLPETRVDTHTSLLPPSTEEVTVTHTVSITSEIVEPKTVAVVSRIEPVKIVTQTHFHKYTKVEPRTITTTISDFTVTSPVHHASIKPTTIITTSYMIHNVLTLDTVTQFVTVTVMTPSAVFHTETEIITKTDFVTFTKRVPVSPSHTSTVIKVVPNPSRLTIDPVQRTITKLVNSVSTVTHTLYSTTCAYLSDDYSSKAQVHQLNNYGINAENLVNNPAYSQTRTSRRHYIQEQDNSFDEVYWPKETKFKRNIWPQGFKADKFSPAFSNSDYPQTDFDISSSDSEAEESKLSLSIRSPASTRESRTLQNYPLVYGIPFYGFKPIDGNYPFNTNSQRVKPANFKQ